MGRGPRQRASEFRDACLWEARVVARPWFYITRALCKGAARRRGVARRAGFGTRGALSGIPALRLRRPRRSQGRAAPGPRVGESSGMPRTLRGHGFRGKLRWGGWTGIGAKPRPCRMEAPTAKRTTRRRLGGGTGGCRSRTGGGHGGSVNAGGGCLGWGALRLAGHEGFTDDGASTLAHGAASGGARRLADEGGKGPLCASMKRQLPSEFSRHRAGPRGKLAVPRGAGARAGGREGCRPRGASDLRWWRLRQRGRGALPSVWLRLAAWDS